MYYPKPDIEKESYFGIGPAFFGAGIPELDGYAVGLGPEFLIGRQWIAKTGSKRHFQVNCIWPIFVHELEGDNVFFPVPVLSLTYGWGF